MISKIRNINLLNIRTLYTYSSEFNRELQIKNSYIYRLEDRVKELEKYRDYRCKKLTKKGQRCKNCGIKVLENGGYCHLHKN